jgi:hypothetical protein
MLEPHIAPPACVTEDAFAALMEISKRPPVAIPQLLRIHAEIAALP